MKEERIKFVEQCGELLRISKPHLVKCELFLGKDIPYTLPVGVSVLPNDEYAVVTAENNYHYAISIEASSLHGIACDIFNAMAHK